MSLVSSTSVGDQQSALCRFIYLSGVVFHNLLGSQITFVTHKQFVDIFICISVDFIEPLFDIVETFLVGDVIYYLREKCSFITISLLPQQAAYVTCI